MTQEKRDVSATTDAASRNDKSHVKNDLQERVQVRNYSSQSVAADDEGVTLRPPARTGSGDGSDGPQKQNIQNNLPLLAFVAGICLFLTGLLIGRSGLGGVPNNVVGADPEDRVEFGLFWDAWDMLLDRYVDKGDIDSQKMLYGAIKGMFASTGDPYTTFLDPEINQAFEEEINGSFDGIGAEIGLRGNLLTIIAPLDDSPAEKAGLRAGDSIIQIDGEISSDLSIEDAVKKIRGERGSVVVLTIFREGDNDTQDISVTRDKIEIKSVTTERTASGIGVIRVSQFGTDTDQIFREELEKMQRDGLRKIIVDLRNNPGGILGGAIQMVSVFVPQGAVAVIEQSSGGAEKVNKTNRKPLFDNDTEIVILINQGSASASEIFAGALKAHLGDRVTLVGQKTFGKGSVQELIQMSGGTSAKITIAKWLTPDRQVIDGEGIAPDVEIEISDEDYDNDRDPQRDIAQQILEGTYDPITVVADDDDAVDKTADQASQQNADKSVDRPAVGDEVQE